MVNPKYVLTILILSVITWCKTPRHREIYSEQSLDHSAEGEKGFQLAENHKELMKNFLKVFEPVMEPQARMTEFEKVVEENLEFLSRDLYTRDHPPVQTKGWFGTELADGEYKKVVKKDWVHTIHRLAESGFFLDEDQKAQLLKEIKKSKASPKDFYNKTKNLGIIDETVEKLGKIAYHGHGIGGGIGRGKIMDKLREVDVNSGKTPLGSMFEIFDTYTKQGLGTTLEERMAKEVAEVRARAGQYSSLVDAVFGYFNNHFKSEELLKKSPDHPFDEISRKKQIGALEGIIDVLLPDDSSRISHLVGGHLDPDDFEGGMFGKAFRQQLADEALDLKSRSFLGVINVVGPTMQKILQTVVTLFDPALQKHLNSVKDALPPIDSATVTERMKNLFGAALPGGQGKGILQTGDEEIRAIKEVWARDFDTKVKLEYAELVLRNNASENKANIPTLEEFIIKKEPERIKGLQNIDGMAETWKVSEDPGRKIANLREVIESVEQSVRNRYKGRYQRGKITSETILEKVDITKQKIIDQYIDAHRSAGNFADLDDHSLRNVINGYLQGGLESKEIIESIPVRQRLGTATIGDAYKVWIANPTPPGGIGEVVVKFKKPGLKEKLEFEKKVFASMEERFESEVKEGVRKTKDLEAIRSQWAQFTGTVQAELNFENESKLLSSVSQSRFYNGVENVAKGAGAALGIHQVDFNVVQVPPGFRIQTGSDIAKSTILMNVAEGDSLTSLIESAEEDYKLKSEKLKGMQSDSPGYAKALEELEESMEEISRLRLVMETAYSNWMTSAFQTGHFHGDPHGGNIFVDMDAVPPKVTYIDLGGSGKLSEGLRKDFSVLIGYLNTGNTAGAFDAINRLCDACTKAALLDPGVRANFNGNTSEKIKSYMEELWVVDKDGVERLFREGDVLGVGGNVREIPGAERMGRIADVLKLDTDFHLNRDLSNYIRAFSIMEGNINEVFSKWGVAKTDFAVLQKSHKLSGIRLKDLHPDMASFRKALVAGDLGKAIKGHVVQDMKGRVKKGFKRALIPATITGAAGAILLGVLFGQEELSGLFLEDSAKLGACEGKVLGKSYCLSFKNLRKGQKNALKARCDDYDGRWVSGAGCNDDEFSSRCRVSHDEPGPETFLYVDTAKPTDIEAMCEKTRDIFENVSYF